jgi:predicted  nucleic acid-binding Zn-ribbon protein
MDLSEQLSRQLTQQMDHVNELLEHIQKLEAQHLAFQRSAQEKQGQLRQALQVADGARAEANDAKRKLAVAQVRSLGHKGRATTAPRARA